jgi:hypothetical protein
LYSLPDSKLNLKDASGWFKVFYRGLDNPLFLPYAASGSFENPITFRLDNFADDDSTRHLYSIMIYPCFLLVGMSTSNRIIKPGYESYQPVIATRQLGIGQVPPHFFLHHLTESRADLPNLVTSQKCYACLMLFTSQSLSTYHLPFQSMASGLGGQCGRIISPRKP